MYVQQHTYKPQVVLDDSENHSCASPKMPFPEPETALASTIYSGWEDYVIPDEIMCPAAR